MHQIQHQQQSFRRIMMSLIVLLTFTAGTASAVVLDEENRLTVVLSDGTPINLIGIATSNPEEKSHEYYYLPVNLRCSKSQDGIPEFLFMKFTSEKGGDAEGALMHFLMEWGLTPEQETELQARLKKEDEKAILKGAVPMLPAGESGTFQIVSGTLGDKELTKNLVTSGKAPLLPGGKTAVAARLEANGAQLLAATFEKTRSITDVSLALDFMYETLVPAAKGTITFDWGKYEEHYESLEAEYERKRTGTDKTKVKVLGIPIFSSSKPTYSYSYDEMRQQYDFLIEQEVIKISFQETVSDERVAKIRDTFFQYFLNTMTEKTEPQGGNPSDPGEQEKEKIPDIRYGNRYDYKKTAFESAYARKTQTIDLSYRMTIRRPYQLVGNLMSWYDEISANEDYMKKCISAVILNDPFFSHRDIKFILDLEAKELFDDAINYATVNVRKKRSDGVDFKDSVTIDAKYVENNGVAATVIYARGKDTNSDLYEYQTQWSLAGGDVFPKDPPWQEGTWEGVTLYPPVIPHTVEVEGDLDEMKTSDITRITVQVRYRKFGEECEENIHISPAKNEPLLSKTLFMDRDAKLYAYRLIVNHKRQGKLVLPWESRANDDYIYATIPEDLLTEGSEANKTAKTTAQKVGAPSEESVLDDMEKKFNGQ